MIPVILSGGSGTRLWPLSRSSFPKQFLSLLEEKSLFQQTISRIVNNSIITSSPIIIGNQEHRFLLAEQCRMIGVSPESIILEPFGRNTAAAIAIACLQALEKNTDPLLLVMPADHMIQDLDALNVAIEQGASLAKDGRIVTFGIIPKYAETGYGYIRVKEKNNEPQDVDKFIEKPNKETAEEYLADGRYYWNSGIFIFKTSSMIKELEIHAPEVLGNVMCAMKSCVRDLDFKRISYEDFSKVPDISIDYAVMEKSSLVSVVPMDASWNDVGSWASVWDIAIKDEDGNSCQGDVIMDQVKNSYVHSDSRLVSLSGVENLIVIETADAVMVASKDGAQEVKKLVDIVKKKNKPQATVHRQVYRPWGHYDSIEQGDRYQVKRIQVLPGQKLSVQMHHHRAEHWVVVAGTAKVYIEGKESLLTENQSVYIPVGAVHALENPGKIPLDMIEVQSGPYLGEDDIVRYEDRYGRVS